MLCSNKLRPLAKFQINSAKYIATEFNMSNKLRYASPVKRLSKINHIKAILFSADFKMALFDSVDHSFFFEIRESFHTGPDFITWVRILFYNAESCVINNGRSTGYFRLEQGIRQGDSLSAYLFILAFRSPIDPKKRK